MTHDAHRTPTDRPGSGPHGSRWRKAAWAAAALVLLVPLIATLATDEVDWSVADFVIAGALLFGVGIAMELATRTSNDTAYRWAVGLALAAAFLLVWVNGAVGVIGSEDDSVNLLFVGVLAVGFVGALLARFRPRGMARAMAATALAQASVAVGALVAGLTSPSGEPVEIVALWFFVALWAGSALLFHRAAQGSPPPSAGPQTR